MNTNSKSKIIILMIGILLIANIILLSFFLLNKPENKRGERKSPMTNYLQNEIGFSKDQMAAFDSIKSNHKNEAKALFDKMRNNKVAAFKELATKQFSDSAIIDAATFSAMQQQQLEVNMLKHLRDIRNICTPLQREKFDTGFYRIMNRTKQHKP
jgi:flagellar basal body-associated protein FliL